MNYPVHRTKLFEMILLALATAHAPAQPQPTASAGGYAYSGSDDIDSVAWYAGSRTTHEVMTKAPQRARSVRHERQCGGMVLGLVRQRILRKKPCGKPARRGFGETSHFTRRMLVQERTYLSRCFPYQRVSIRVIQPPRLPRGAERKRIPARPKRLRSG